MDSPDEQVNPLDSTSPPTSPEETIPSPLASTDSSPFTARPPQRAAASDMQTSTVFNMTASSQPLGNVNAARRPAGAPIPTARGGITNPDILARVRNFHISRQSTPNIPQQSARGSSPSPAPGGADPPTSPPQLGSPPGGLHFAPHLGRPGPHMSISSPAIAGVRPPGKGPSLAEKRGMKLPGGLPGQPSSPNPAAPGAPAGRRPKPSMKLSDMNGGQANGAPGADERSKEQSQLDRYADIIDTKSGSLIFKGKATVTGEGIDFTSGKTFKISLDEVDTLDELGKGNYGTVYKVRHARPKFRRAGQGLAGNKAIRPSDRTADESSTSNSPTTANKGGTTGIVMAMKEMRLELDDAKFQSIIMELDILHRCVSPYIIDFYGAFFQEGAVYICIEYMDGGSIDKLYGDGVPENVLRKITLATVLGLKSLKEEHNIIHRDVKPTNILVNTRGQVKICDFGVSGNLVASIAKTNIGCQSYMAPERISSGGMAQAGAGAGTYSVQSDIWSLGLTIIECAMGRYPYPPETYDNIFSQLSAIVDGEPPDLPADKFSEASRDFVAGCLNKIPKLRPTYPMLLQHAWLAPLIKPETIMEEDEDAEAAGTDGSSAPPAPSLAVNNNGAGTGPDDGVVDQEVSEWVLDALEKRKQGVLGKSPQPALHAAPLDAVSPGIGRNAEPVAV